MPDSSDIDSRAGLWADLVQVMSDHLASHERLADLSDQLTHELLDRNAEGVSRVAAEQAATLAEVERLEARRIAVVDALTALAGPLPVSPSLRAIVDSAPDEAGAELAESAGRLTSALERISIVTQTNKRLLVQADGYVRALLKAAAGTETASAAYTSDGRSPKERSGRALLDRRA